MAIDEKGRRLAEQCSASRDAVLQGVDWLTVNAEQVKQDRPALMKELRKAAIAARRLERAAMRKMCVGIFGISQSGKSYLVSALARKEGRPLMADFAGTKVDFLDQINPEGGGESTGLVTRFTVDRPADLPAGYPIEVRLLSEMDVVKILVNSYANDVYHADEEEQHHDREKIMAAVAKLGAGGGEQRSAQVSAEDIYDLEDYCNARLIGNPRIKALRRIGFWDRAAELIPSLGPAERQKLFAIIWDDMPVFNGIYARLQNVLVKLGLTDTAYCALDGLLENADGGALLRHPRSIIQVSTLGAFNRTDGAGRDDVVGVRTAAGREVAVARSELTALIAELRIVMKEKPDDFFDYTDLLDFPGARTRTPLPKPMVSGADANVSELLLRGKVSYLFDRYNAEQELTSLVLCAGPENNEVEGIDELLFSWISATHGETAEQRSASQTSLFVVLTKFDTSFAESAGKKNPYPNRLRTSLLEPYCKRHTWPVDWAGERAFRNCYAVRNPKFKQDAMFDYLSSDKSDGEAYYTEKNLRADKVKLVADFERLFLESEDVVRHFADAPRAWQALMTLNDGGVGYLVANLKPVCNPDIKHRQVEAQLGRLCETVRSRLATFYVSGDQDEELRKKQALVQEILRNLAGCLKKHRFAELLEHFQVTDPEVFDLHFAAKSLPDEPAPAADAAEPVPEPVADASDVLDELAGLFDAPPAPATPAPAARRAPEAPKRQGFAQRFTDTVEGYWAERLRDFRERGEALAYFGIKDDMSSHIAEELVVGARRLGVFQDIAAEVAQFEQFKDSARVWKQVTAASVMLNDYLSYLGFGGRRNRNGTRIERQGKLIRHVFKPRERVQQYPQISPTEFEYDKEYSLDWLAALGQLIVDNVGYRAGIAGSMESNARLGGVLEILKQHAH